VIVRVAQFLRRNYVPGTALTRWVDAPGDEMDAWLAEAEHIVGMVLGWEECSEQIAAQAASAEAHWHGLSDAQRGEQVRAALSDLIMHPAMRLRVNDAVDAPHRTHFE
jgi:hypothetical protein